MAPEIKKEKKEENKIKVSLKEMPKKSKDAGEAKERVQKPEEIAQPMPKGSQLKEMVQSAPKPPVKYEPKKAQSQNTPKLNETKKEEQKTEPTPKTEPLPSSKTLVPLQESETKKATKKKDDPMWFHLEDKSYKSYKSLFLNPNQLHQ